MADIQFEEEQQYRQGYQAEQKPFMIRLVLSTGIVSTDDAAKKVLLAIAVIAVLLAIGVLIFSGGNSRSIPQVPVVPFPTADSL